MANSAYPTTKQLFLYQGDSWLHEFDHTYAAADVDGAGFAVALRAGGTAVYSINDTNEAAQFSTTNNLTAVSIPAAAAALFDPGIYFYDLQLDVNGTTITVARGAFVVDGDAYDGDGGGLGFATSEISNRLIAWTLAEMWTFTSVPTRDADGTISSASIRWPDNTVGTFTRTGKHETVTGVAVSSFTVTYNALTVTQPATTLDALGNITSRPRPTVA